MIELGRHSYVCNPIIRGRMGTLKIGSFSSVAEDTIFDLGFNHNYKMATSFPLKKIWSQLESNIKFNGDILLGNDVWVGERCVVMSGVHIGDGCVVGANTVVTKSLPPYTVKAGTKTWPRFGIEQVTDLVRIAWWNWTDERILANAHLLLSEDIDNFIKNHV